jgi:hypothetical protein
VSAIESVTASFILHLHGGGSVNEQQLLANDEALRRRLQHDFYGAIVIRAPGQPDVTVDDEVTATVFNLCFSAISDVLEGRPVEVPYMRYSGSVRVEPVAHRVRVSGDMVPEATYITHDFTWAVYCCGERFVEYLRRIAGVDRSASEQIPDLEEARVKARRALDSVV